MPVKYLSLTKSFVKKMKEQSNRYYHFYKPLRNLSAKFDVEESIQHIWNIGQYISIGKNLPILYRNFLNNRFDIRTQLPIWELALAFREIILNSNYSKSCSLNNYKDFANIMNCIKHLDNNISKQSLSESNVLISLHRIAHLQFPWQRSVDQNTLLRYRSIFSYPQLNELIKTKVGLDIDKLIIFTLLLKQHFSKNNQINLDTDFRFIGISNVQSIFVLKRISTSLDELRNTYQQNQQYDERWQYTWNCLESFPLIFFSQYPNVLYCPFPELLNKRLTEGLFFDVVNPSSEFTKSYGESYQNYVGKLLKAVFKENKFVITQESEYMDGKQIKHGIDWILSDDKSNLFIECKTKRLRLNSKIDTSGETLKEDLHIMAEAVIQTYKNINDALNNKSNWKNNQQSIFPLILTLEDWLLLSPPIKDELEKIIKGKLELIGLPIEYIVTMPYTISSIQSFEKSYKAIIFCGIHKYMSLKTSAEYKSWDIKEFSREVLKDSLEKNDECIFSDELKELRLTIDAMLKMQVKL